MKTSYFVITPRNNVGGPFASIDEAQQNIPDSHDTSAPDHVTDMKGCLSNICGDYPELRSADFEHVETWVADESEYPDEDGYLIFSATA